MASTGTKPTELQYEDTRKEVEIAPIRKLVKRFYRAKDKDTYFGNYKVYSTTETIQYFFDGEWKDLPEVHESHNI